MGKQKAHRKAAQQQATTTATAPTGNGGAQIAQQLGTNVPDAFIADLASQWGMTVERVRAKPALMAEVVKAYARHQADQRKAAEAAEVAEDERLDERAILIIQTDGERDKKKEPRNDKIKGNCPLIPPAVYETRHHPFWDLIAFAIVIKLLLRVIAETYGWKKGDGQPKSADQELMERPFWAIRNEVNDCLNGGFRFNPKMLEGLAGKVSINTFERLRTNLTFAREAGNREAVQVMSVVGPKLDQFIADLYQAERDAREAARHQREVQRTAERRANEAAQTRTAYEKLHAPVADDHGLVVPANSALAFLAEISADPTSLLDGCND